MTAPSSTALEEARILREPWGSPPGGEMIAARTEDWVQVAATDGCRDCSLEEEDTCALDVDSERRNVH